MQITTLNEWIDELRARFDDRERLYMSVQKAKIVLQLKDQETGEFHLHNLDYQSKDAQDLKVMA